MDQSATTIVPSLYADVPVNRRVNQAMVTSLVPYKRLWDILAGFAPDAV